MPTTGSASSWTSPSRTLWAPDRSRWWPVRRGTGGPMWRQPDQSSCLTPLRPVHVLMHPFASVNQRRLQVNRHCTFISLLERTGRHGGRGRRERPRDRPGRCRARHGRAGSSQGVPGPSTPAMTNVIRSWSTLACASVSAADIPHDEVVPVPGLTSTGKPRVWLSTISTELGRKR